ncbi:ammonium transporter [Asimina triloba]
MMSCRTQSVRQPRASRRTGSTPSPAPMKRTHQSQQQTPMVTVLKKTHQIRHGVLHQQQFEDAAVEEQPRGISAQQRLAHVRRSWVVAFITMLVQTWAAVIMGVLSGSISWFSMMILHKKSVLLQQQACRGRNNRASSRAEVVQPRLTHEKLKRRMLQGQRTIAAGGHPNIISTTVILLIIRLFMPLWMPDEHLVIGEDAVHGEEVYSLWDDGEKYNPTRHDYLDENLPARFANEARGVTIQL